MITVEHKAQSPASRDAVWARLSDLESWHEWGPWTETTLDGDIRTLVSERKRMTGKPYVMKERVTAMVPNERFEYDLLSGLPVKNYHSVVRLHDLPGGGTEIYWRSTFDSPWPIFKGLWRGAMQKVIRDVSERLATAKA
jgi:Polyketide cyclase / dehydrase and lipid transport